LYFLFLFSLFKDNKCESGAGSTKKVGKRKEKGKGLNGRYEERSKR
jgi:hypothetical protein